MTYAFPQYFESKSRFMTYALVYRVLINAGNKVIDNINECDAVLCSLCDVTEYKYLVRLRKLTDKPIIVGGAFAFNYWSAILYSNAVWIGEAFDFADCKTLGDVYDSAHCYTGASTKSLVASQRVDWGVIPVCQIAPGKCYYLGGVGCKNKCRFCFTSWTHQHAINSQQRILAARRVAKDQKMHLMVVSNEYDAGDVGGTTRDMLLTDYISEPVRGASFVRCGIEFATDDSRKRNGKAITDAQIVAALRKSNDDNVSLRFFHIAGYDDIKDWERYIGGIAGTLKQYPNNRLVHLMFNNLQYQNYTPLYAERRDIDPSKYIDISVTKAWYDTLRQASRHVLVGAPSPFQHVACRMGVELSTSREQLDYWLSMAVNPSGKLTIDDAYQALFNTGVLDTERRAVNVNTGEIRTLAEKEA